MVPQEDSFFNKKTSAIFLLTFFSIFYLINFSDRKAQIAERQQFSTLL